MFVRPVLSLRDVRYTNEIQKKNTMVVGSPVQQTGPTTTNQLPIHWQSITDWRRSSDGLTFNGDWMTSGTVESL